MKHLSGICFAFFLLVGFTSCTIEKRHYRDGFYVNWNHNTSKPAESSALSEPVVSCEVPNRIVKLADTSSIEPEAKQAEEIPAIADHHSPKLIAGKSEQETPEDIPVNPEKSQAPAPIEKDKKQAVGAGVAAAIFFILAMVGLIIKGTAPPVGIFIGAAFLCCILCIVLASFLYPRDPVVPQPKDPAAVSSGSRVTAIAAVVIGAIVLSVLGVFAFLFLSLLGAF